LPKALWSRSSFAVSFEPRCVQVEPERLNTHAAPVLPLSSSPPIRAVLPSADSATPPPKVPAPLSSLPVSFEPCCVQVEPERVNTPTAPPLAVTSLQPPIRAVLPSADSATLRPTRLVPVSPLTVSFAPCCVQLEPERVYTRAAPAPSSSPLAPIKAVLPSADS